LAKRCVSKAATWRPRPCPDDEGRITQKMNNS
jgi:hypothetical protein